MNKIDELRMMINHALDEWERLQEKCEELTKEKNRYRDMAVKLKNERDTAQKKLKVLSSNKNIYNIYD